jgi:hypothetical protein
MSKVCVYVGPHRAQSHKLSEALNRSLSDVSETHARVFGKD